MTTPAVLAYLNTSPSTFCCPCGVSRPFLTLLFSSCRRLSLLFYLGSWFSLVFSLLHTASLKHSLKPMHESNLAHLKLSKVRALCVWPPSVSISSYRGGHRNSNASTIHAVPHNDPALNAFVTFDHLWGLWCCWITLFCKVLLFPACVNAILFCLPVVFFLKIAMLITWCSSYSTK